ncbi:MULTISPECIES: hypothetical protein [unclassified Streptomyces]|uniref:hypothetical protein n=1 Tax=unclassified Streptomyces TaxID=2593676 RepID=UPI0024410EDA|nr:hypothetical protein [Streptomyces sp. DH41]MDG9728654.1 hypothetical protein [Streptomyces sp. DH41]
MAQRETPRPSLVSSCLDFLEVLTQFSDKLSKTLRGATKTGRDAQAAYRNLRDVCTLAVRLWRSVLTFFSGDAGTAQTC